MKIFIKRLNNEINNKDFAISGDGNKWHKARISSKNEALSIGFHNMGLNNYVSLAKLTFKDGIAEYELENPRNIKDSPRKVSDKTKEKSARMGTIARPDYDLWKQKGVDVKLIQQDKDVMDYREKLENRKTALNEHLKKLNAQLIALSKDHQENINLAYKEMEREKTRANVQQASKEDKLALLKMLQDELKDELGV